MPGVIEVLPIFDVLGPVAVNSRRPILCPPRLGRDSLDEGCEWAIRTLVEISEESQIYRALYRAPRDLDLLQSV